MWGLQPIYFDGSSLTQIGSNINKIYDIEPFDTFEYITEEMLIQEIKNISVHKSSGLDLPSYFLKVCFELQGYLL